MPSKNIRDLPVKQSFPPSRQPMIVENFAEVWLRDLLETGYDEFDLAIPAAGPFRASWASKRCDRALQYAMSGEPASEAKTVADYWRFYTGTMVHNSINEAMRKMGDGWIPDIDVDLNPMGIAGSAHADLVRFVDCVGQPWEWVGIFNGMPEDRPEDERHIYEASDPDETVVLRVGEWDQKLMIPTHVAELKSVGGYNFKMAATSQGGPPEGPRYGAIMQGAYAAAALGVDKLLIVNLSLENVSPKLAAAYSTSEVGRFAAEWKYLISDLQPHIDADVARIARIARANEAKVLVAREVHDPEVPSGAVITNPANSLWQIRNGDEVEQFGSIWNGSFCLYCDHRSKCIEDGAGTDTTEVSL